MHNTVGVLNLASHCEGKGINGTCVCVLLNDTGNCLHYTAQARDVKCFKISLKRFLCHHSFYTIKEFYDYNENKPI